MTTGEARAAVLERIRAALADRPEVPPIPRDYQVESPPGVDIVSRFAERVADYRATVRRIGEDDLAAVVGDMLEAIPARQVIVPAGVPSVWMSACRGEVVSDTPPLTHAALDAADAVITSCAIAIAETGTIVLDGGRGQGRRVLTLLPDHHLCVVRADQIVGDVPEALTRLDPRRPLTWISGPSATSDIELQRVEGVHGPRHLVVLIVEQPGV